MGLIKTKYEDTENQNIRFDYSKFDYMYDDETFPADSFDDFDNILQESLISYTVERETYTEDTMGMISNMSTSTFSVYAIIQDISRKDRQIADMGLAVPGNRKMFYKPTYSGGEVLAGDIIKDTKDSNRQWRVIKVLNKWRLPNQDVFNVAIIQNIYQGS